MSKTAELIRPARVGDGESIVRLFRKTMRPELLPLTIFGAHGAAGYLDDLFKPRDPGQPSVFFVASTGSKTTGCIEIRGMASHLFINHIYVDPDEQGRRLGSRILLTGLSRMRERRHFGVRLDTETDNLRAQDWYRRLGLAVKKTYGLWLISPSEGGDADACESNIEDNEIKAQYRKYGFCQFELRTASGTYEAGMLGSALFKTADKRLLLDRRAMAFLQEVDPNRRILFAGTLPEGIHAAQADQALKFLRMEGSLSGCLRYLRDK